MLKFQENILNFINCKGSSFQNILYQRAVYHLHRWNSRRGFFYNNKSRNSKIYPFANVKSFWHLMWKTFCYSGGPIQSKPIYRIVTGQSIDYKSVNDKTFFTSDIKNFSHLPMHIFCYFNFYQCRRNAFRSNFIFKFSERFERSRAPACPYNENQGRRSENFLGKSSYSFLYKKYIYLKEKSFEKDIGIWLTNYNKPEGLPGLTILASLRMP